MSAFQDLFLFIRMFALAVPIQCGSILRDHIKICERVTEGRNGKCCSYNFFEKFCGREKGFLFVGKQNFVK